MANPEPKLEYQRLAEEMSALAKELGQTEVVAIIDALSERISKDTMSCAVIEVKPDLFSDIRVTLFPDFFSQDVRDSDVEWKIPAHTDGPIPNKYSWTCFRTPDIRNWQEFCHNSELWTKLIDADVVLVIIDSRLKPSAEERIKYLNLVLNSRLFFLQPNVASLETEKVAEDNKRLLSDWFSMKREDLRYFRLYSNDEFKKFEEILYSEIILKRGSRRTECLFQQIVFSGTYLLNLLEFYRAIDREHTEWNKSYDGQVQTFKATLPILRNKARSLLELRLPRSHPPRVVRNITNPITSESLRGRNLEDYFKRLRGDLIQEIRQIVDEIDRDCASEIQNFIDEATSSLEFLEMFTTDAPITQFPSSAFPEEEPIEAPNFSKAVLWRRVGRSVAPSLYPASFAAYMISGIKIGAASGTPAGPLGWGVGAIGGLIVGTIFAANAFFADERHQLPIAENKIKDELTYTAYDASALVIQYVTDSLEETSDLVIQGLEQRKESVEKKVAVMKHHNSNIDYEKAKTEINKLIKGAEVHFADHTTNNTSGNR